MNIYQKAFVAAICLTLYQSCQKHEAIDDEFNYYVDAFLAEGNQRGLNLRRDNISVSIEFDDLGILAGTCQRWGSSVKIDKNFWERATPEKRKWLIFHELGHCVLNRGHKNECTTGREGMSWMLGGEENCSINFHSQIWEEFYLDELFNMDTPTLWWQKPQSHTYPLMTECALVDSSLTGFFEDTIDVRGLDFFLFDIAFENDLHESPVFVINFGDVRISYCPTCVPDKVRLSIKEKSVYSSSVSPPFSEGVKFSIVKEHSVNKFFVNETYLHTIESSVSDKLIVTGRRLDEPALHTTRLCTD